MSVVDDKHKRLVNLADKYVRQKEYACLFPGCTRKAINSHSIPQASIVDGLSEHGHVYSSRQSHNQMIRMTSPAHPLEVIEVGVKNAGTFKGYCPEHDLALFRSAETANLNRKYGMQISLHLKAWSLEYCRRRQARDFLRRFSELVDRAELRTILCDGASQMEVGCVIGKNYLDSTFALILGSPVDSIESYTLAFSGNLQVSCCGCLNDYSTLPEALLSAIAFNFISYSDISFLSLTVFKVVEKYLNQFVGKYDLPADAERLLNEIAFLRCEEPLISPKLWRSLTDEQKHEIGLSLRPPHVRSATPAPAIIKIDAKDRQLMVTQELAARLGYPGAKLNQKA